MARKATWKIVRWDSKPTSTTEIETECSHCGHLAYLPTGVIPRPIAVIGNGFVFDPQDYPPPDGWFPEVIQCRRCRHNFEHATVGAPADVR